MKTHLVFDAIAEDPLDDVVNVKSFHSSNFDMEDPYLGSDWNVKTPSIVIDEEIGIDVDSKKNIQKQ